MAGPRIPKYQAIHERLRTEILAGDLAPGSRLPPQSEMAERFGVTLMTLRQAVAALEADGLVRAERGRGTFVAERPVDIRLGNLSSFAEQMAADSDVGTWVQTNTRFHTIFHRATRTQRLANMLVTLEEASGVFVAQTQTYHPQTRRRAIEDHFALLEAVEAKDVDLALEVQRRHLQLPLESHALDV